MCCCGLSICATCPSCGGICGTCTCAAALSDAFSPGCITGAPCVVSCPGACPAIQAAYCPNATVDPGSNVDLSNLPLTSPSGDPNLDGLTPSANTTDNPPSTTACPSSPRGGGGGGGSAKSSGLGGNGSIGSLPHNTQNAGVTALSNVLSRLGTSMASVFGKAETAKTGLEQKTVNAITTPAFLLMILVVGGLLIMLAWGRKES